MITEFESRPILALGSMLAKYHSRIKCLACIISFSVSSQLFYFIYYILFIRSEDQRGKIPKILKRESEILVSWETSK